MNALLLRIRTEARVRISLLLQVVFIPVSVWYGSVTSPVEGLAFWLMLDILADLGLMLFYKP